MPSAESRFRSHEEICYKSAGMKPLQELTAQHDLMVGMLLGDLDKPPLSKTEVANLFGITKDAVTAITSSPLFSKKMRERRAILQESIEAAKVYYQRRAPQLAFEAVDMALTCKNEAVRGAMLRDSLDRAGLAPKVEIDIKAQIQTATYSDEELRRVIFKRLNASGISLEDVVDGELVPQNGDGADE